MVVATIPVGTSPSTIAYDSGNGYVDVGNYGSHNVSIISGTNLIGTVQVGGSPRVGPYDPHDRTVYVANYATGNLSVISGTRLSGTVTVGNQPLRGAFNDRFGWVYIPNFGSNTVSVVAGTTQISTINVGSGPIADAYDSAVGLVYVANVNSANVSVVTGGIHVADIPVGINPVSVETGAAVYVANQGSNNVSVLDPGLNLAASVGIQSPNSMLYDPFNGYLYVSGSGVVSVISGLSVVATIPVGSSPDKPALDTANGYVYVPNFFSNNVSVISGTSVVGTIAVGNGPTAAVYDSRDGFVYVPSDMSNTVSVIGPPGPTVASFGASPPSIPLGGSTVFQVSAGNGSGNLTYVYSGLPPGCATANTTALVCTPSSAGSYVVTVQVSDQLGRTASRATAITIRAAPAGSYPVTFTESGLPAGANWSVTLSGSTLSATSTAITFIEPNGTFPFTSGAVQGYSSTPGSGAVTISGAGKTVTLAYTAIPQGSFLVTWTETGLSLGTNWSVTLGGTTRASTGISLSFTEPSGNFSFTLGAVLGYAASPKAGYIIVNGHSLNESVTFSASSPGPSAPIPATFLGLPLWEGLGILGLAALIAALLLLSLFGCPNRCTPEGKKIGCSSSVYLDTTPCGQPPDWAGDVKAGAEIMALAAELAKKIEIVGEAYAEILKVMPKWVDAAGELMKKKVGLNAYATVVCRWKACRNVPCWVFWKQLDWVPGATIYGPYKLKPPSGYGDGTGEECFKVGLEPGELSKGIAAALADSTEVAEAKKKCAKECE